MFLLANGPQLAGKHTTRLSLSASSLSKSGKKFLGRRKVSEARPARQQEADAVVCRDIPKPG
jgi:hypothetical protein